MRYLFFDIECCNGRNICEFGYVITDDKFNILEKKDFTINPENKFLGEEDGKYKNNKRKIYQNKRRSIIYTIITLASYASIKKFLPCS